MSTRRWTTIATASLVVVLAAGCSDEESPSATDGSDSSPPASAPSDPSPEQDATEEPTEDSASGSAVTIDSLTGEATRLTVDDRYVSALGAIGAELTAVGGAQTETSGGTTTFVFPVTGGTVTVDPDGADPLVGTVQHEGGLQLSALGRSATVNGLVLDGDEDRLTAMIGGRQVTLLPLSMSDAQVTQADGQVVIEDTAVSFDAETTNALAEQLGLPVTLPAVNVGSLESTLTGS